MRAPSIRYELIKGRYLNNKIIWRIVDETDKNKIISTTDTINDHEIQAFVRYINNLNLDDIKYQELICEYIK